MSHLAGTVANAAFATGRVEEPLAPWLLVLLGLAALYLPSAIDLIGGVWRSPEQLHGPVVLGISLWLIHRKWPEMLTASAGAGTAAVGWPVLLLGLGFYVSGRSQDILVFEIGSLIWVLAGLALLLRGSAALKVQWFPLLFMAFMVPLPGVIVDTVTMPMKLAVSNVTEHVLYAADYPVARSGVMLQIGQYKLLVADACAGLHTLLTLESLGLLYLNLVRHDSMFRNIALAGLIVPISFAANVIRVISLTLITYHFGDAAGQGFLHVFAGLVLFASALLIIVAADSLLQRTAGRCTAARFVSREHE